MRRSNKSAIEKEVKNGGEEKARLKRGGTHSWGGKKFEGAWGKANNFPGKGGLSIGGALTRGACEMGTEWWAIKKERTGGGGRPMFWGGKVKPDPTHKGASLGGTCCRRTEGGEKKYQNAPASGSH